MTERKAGPHSGKRLNQKLKPYVVLQYLLKNTDENMVSSAQDIVAYLEECGIDAERRSVYRDIKDIKGHYKDRHANDSGSKLVQRSDRTSLGRTLHRCRQSLQHNTVQKDSH